MASPVAAQTMEPPRKRQKLSPSPSTSTPINSSEAHEPSQDITMTERPNPSVGLGVSVNSDPERSVGILQFVNANNPGFTGILKQRYTDFLVNEIDLDGNVIHLTRVSVPKEFSAKQNVSGQETTQNAEEVPAEPSEKAEEKSSEESKMYEQKYVGPPKKSLHELEISDKKAPPAFVITDADVALLEEYFGSTTRSAILILNTKIMSRPDAKASSFDSVFSEPITDRQLRTKIHQDLRRIFDSRFESSSDATGAIKISAAVQQRKPNPRNNPSGGNAQQNGRGGQQKGKLGWEQLGGQYLHFTLYKENKDTMEMLNLISAKMHQKTKNFTFAGTKDRRAVTVQRVSAFRVAADQLVKMNQWLYGAKVGNFKYMKHDLQLGDLSGNEFYITLRDCKFPSSGDEHPSKTLAKAKAIVEDAMKNLCTNGFLNYYGLQRFGSYAVGTDVIGKKILQGDYEGAVDSILAYDKDVLEAALIPKEEQSTQQQMYSKDDRDRAWAIMKFKRTGSSKLALGVLPRRFNAESTLITHLSGQNRSGDYLGGLLKISRTLRLMYVHAYQSLVWNMATSQRWARFGGKVVNGDLVLIDSKEAANSSAKEEELDQNGEVVILPAADDTAINASELFQRARPLTEEEAASGKYTIFDIVLPTPGFDIEYPDNEIGDYYKKFMMSDEGGNLDPSDMRRSSKDFSLSGSYRKIMGGIGKEWSCEVKEYIDENEQMVLTDVEVMHGVTKPGEKTESSRPGNGKPKPANAVASSTYVRPTAESAARTAATETWKVLPTKLAADGEAENLAATAARQTGNGLETAQAAFKETYIQTSVDSGKSERTGHFTKTLIPGTDGSEMPPPPSPPTKSVDRPSPLAAPGVEFPSAPSTDSYHGSEESGGVPVPPSPVKNDDPAETESSEGGIPIVMPKIAVVVKFQLGSSQYATMALRELMKLGGVQQYKAEFGQPRRKD